MGDIPLIIIIFIVVIVIFVIIFFWSSSVKKSIIIPTLSSYTPAVYGMRCATDTISRENIDNFPGAYFPQPCGEGLKCISTTSDLSIGFCRKALGTLCSNIYECDPSA